ncbi:hypothetical protein QYM41_12645 [Kocuria sp. CPCC 205268]|uniref:hypothetical protein n=1 Tax=Kocuria oxytropis TaxID=3058913 RepID=UPI0034D69317
MSASTASSSTSAPPAVSASVESPTPTVTGVTEDIDPNGDLAIQLKQRFPGYPLLIDASTIDSDFEFVKESYNVGEQVVALLPGVYATYN